MGTQFDGDFKIEKRNQLVGTLGLCIEAPVFDWFDGEIQFLDRSFEDFFLRG